MQYKEKGYLVFFTERPLHYNAKMNPSHSKHTALCGSREYLSCSSVHKAFVRVSQDPFLGTFLAEGALQQMSVLPKPFAQTMTNY